MESADDIVDAIANSDIARVTALLDAGVSPDTRDGEWPLLLHAVIHKNEAIVKLLVEHGADVNVANGDGEGPLHYAMGYHNYMITRILLDAGANPDQMGFFGTPLHTAVEKNNVDAAKLLIERGATVYAMSDDGETGTPLHRCDSAAMVELLLSHGADVDNQDSYGHTALHEAARSGRLEVVRALLDHGANATIHSHNGWTPLHWAVWNGHLQTLALLLGRVTDPNPHAEACHGTSGWTPLCWQKPEPLESAGTTAMVKGWTALHLAAIQGLNEIAALLLEKGADVNSDAVPLGTPLRWAQLMGHEYTAALLRKHAGHP